MREIGQMIKKARKERGLTRKELSILSGVAYPTLRDIERRNKMGKEGALEKVLAALNMDIDLVAKEEPSSSAGTAARQVLLFYVKEGKNDVD
jgi:transcriptional regulator with XRE-family HTH domain